MRYFYDTEFREDGRTIDLISIGIVAEDGREYYAINSEADWKLIRGDDWLMDNVVRHLPSIGAVREASVFDIGRKYTWGGLNTRNVCVKPKWVIANEVREFLLGGGTPPELWASYGAYDHVALAQLWGKMTGLPTGIPMWTNDIQQEFQRDVWDVPPRDDRYEHNALADAREVKRAYEFLHGYKDQDEGS